MKENAIFAALVAVFLFLAYTKGLSDQKTVLTAQYQQAYIDQYNHYRDRAQTLQAQVDVLDSTHTKEMLDAQITIDTLLSDVNRGVKRLYVKAKCPSPVLPGAAKTANATGVDYAARRAELDPDAAQRLIQLTTRGDNAIRQLTACQTYIQTLHQSYP